MWFVVIFIHSDVLLLNLWQLQVSIIRTFANLVPWVFELMEVDCLLIGNPKVLRIHSWKFLFCCVIYAWSNHGTSNLQCSTICDVCWTMLRVYVKLTYICWTTNQIYFAIICSQFFIRKDSSVGSTLASWTRGPRFESLAPHLTEFFFLSVYDDILLACDFYISFHSSSSFFFRIEVN